MALCFVASVGNASACTVSEDMTSSLPLNSTETQNSDRLKIADMMLAAKQWPDVEIRGIVYAGGYIKERDAKAIAVARAAILKSYLVQLGVKEGNIWLDTRIIKEPDIDDKGVETLDQIAVTLVPICDGGCERLCSDPRVMPNSKAVK
ncbi:hypothetical protein [Paraburkholderia sp. ZP32-5]|uniref:hypothetical protein n=1 Tax=Paraburkholderia sp. ZP32-5 TaxID=2883245 RepID=UPI001F3F60CA|nr:hypothetical protein [Paraburkholderia sp. ZP32-5]